MITREGRSMESKTSLWRFLYILWHSNTMEPSCASFSYHTLRTICSLSCKPNHMVCAILQVCVLQNCVNGLWTWIERSMALMGLDISMYSISCVYLRFDVSQSVYKFTYMRFSHRLFMCTPYFSFRSGSKCMYVICGLILMRITQASVFVRTLCKKINGFLYDICALRESAPKEKNG